MHCEEEVGEGSIGRKGKGEVIDRWAGERLGKIMSIIEKEDDKG